jgi:hypothetical protein
VWPVAFKLMSATVAQCLTFSDRVFFVSRPSQIVDSLFTGPTTASGTFQVRRNGIALYDLKGHLRSFIVANPGQDPFIVSCGRQLMKNGKQRTVYMQALCALDELWLDVRGMSWAEECAIARRLWAETKPAP